MKSNWLFWGLAAFVVYSIAKSAQAAAFVGPINQPNWSPGPPLFVGPINQPASTGGAAATNPAYVATGPVYSDPQTLLWDPCYQGSLVYDPQACGQAGRQTYQAISGGY